TTSTCRRRPVPLRLIRYEQSALPGEPAEEVALIRRSYARARRPDLPVIKIIGRYGRAQAADGRSIRRDAIDDADLPVSRPTQSWCKQGPTVPVMRSTEMAGRQLPWRS